MSRSRLFLGGLVSTRARFRFTSRIHFTPTGCSCEPHPQQGGGLFDRRNAEFSTGVDRSPSLRALCFFLRLELLPDHFHKGWGVDLEPGEQIWH